MTPAGDDPALRVRPRPWRTPVLLAIALAGLMLGGCLYLRLLELKHQLASFDRYFETDLHDGIKITCKEPVLLDADLAFFKLVPESCAKIGVAARWHFRWVKINDVSGENPRNFEITADFIFVDHRLTRVILPERLFAFIPKQFFLTMVRAFGHAQVDKLKQTAAASAREDLGPRTAQMTQPDLKKLLGAPEETSSGRSGLLWHYRYRAASPDQNSGLIDVIFTLNPATRKVGRIQGRLFNATLDVEFPDSTPLPPADKNSALHGAVS